MRTIWIDVDTQADFCAPTGALFVKGADALAPTWAALTQHALTRGELILGSVDAHAFDAWEFAGAKEAGPNGERPGFPPHCVKGTPGQLKLPETLAPRTRFVPCVPVTEAWLDRELTSEVQQLLLEKEVYSLFANPNAEALLRRLAATPTRFLVYGVALDYCVRAAALGLVEYSQRAGLLHEVWLLQDATAAVDPREGAPRSLEECRMAGVKLMKASELLASGRPS